MNDLFLVVLIILACLGVTLYVLLYWRAKQNGTTQALIHHEKQLDGDYPSLQDGDRETSFHFIEAAKWPI